MRRQTSRVSFLMCPFCVRALVPREATRLEAASKRAKARGEHLRSGGRGPADATPGGLAAVVRRWYVREVEARER
jgi:hypothetical protein